LLDLILDLDRKTPWFTAEEEAESLDEIPPPPVPLSPPQLPSRLPVGLTAEIIQRWLLFRSFMKEHRRYEENLKNWQTAMIVKMLNPEDNPGPKPIAPVQPVRLSSRELAGYEMFDDYHNKLEKYEQSVSTLTEYKRRLPEFRRRHELHHRILLLKSRHRIHKRSFARLEGRLRSLLQGKDFNFERLNWTILPGGGSLMTSVGNYLINERKRHPTVDFDETRIHRILTLEPSQAFAGIDEFDGYLVFLFQGIPFAVLTCPRVGNALYLLKDNWQTLAKLSKSQLLADHAAHVRRIIHVASGEWFDKLRTELRAGRKW
jgi:hypothetical protein